MNTKSEYLPLKYRRRIRLSNSILYRRIKSHNQYWLKEELEQPFGELMWVRDFIASATI